jgi:uncharacterized protein (DUF488 family)
VILSSKATNLFALTTIGYEGASLSAFLETLEVAGITLLLDVRELAMSRRKGFAKTALSQALSAAGIGYRHERALGAPKKVRHQLREDGDLRRYFVEFRKYLATQDAFIDQLATTLGGRVALMCFERNPAECHRSVVVEALARRANMDFHHLTVSADDAKQTSTHPRTHSRQGLSATE